MKKIFITFFALSMYVFGKNATAQTISMFDADKFQYALSEEKKPQLLDVRTKAEFDAGHLKGAKNIDVNAVEFQEKVKNKFKKDRIIFVYCRTDRRSQQAALILKNLEFKHVYVLKGGYLEWENEGKSIKKSTR